MAYDDPRHAVLRLKGSNLRPHLHVKPVLPKAKIIPVKGVILKMSANLMGNEICGNHQGPQR